jgi:hypothetical protein
MLLENRSIAWEYVGSLRSRLPTIETLFPLQRDFDVGLASYSMLMCLLELGYDGAHTLAALKKEQIKVVEHFDVPPMFGTMRSDVVRAAVARTFGSRQTVGLVESRTNAKREVLTEIWPKWNLGLNRVAHGMGWDGTDELRLGDLA